MCTILGLAVGFILGTIAFFIGVFIYETWWSDRGRVKDTINTDDVVHISVSDVDECTVALGATIEEWLKYGCCFEDNNGNTYILRVEDARTEK